MPNSAPTADLEQASGLRKSLGLRDLVLAQILYIVGMGWVGVAGKLGSSHVVFWVMAITLFYLPSSVVVVHLNRLMPLEGGLYQWAKLGFNEITGFMVAWNLWVYAIVLNSEVGIIATTLLSYSLGPEWTWLRDSPGMMTVASLLIVCSMSLVAILGLRTGKWIQNAGALVMMIVFVAVIALPFRNQAIGRLAAYHPLATSMPPLTLYNLNILGKMCFGALGGIEFMAIFAGECKGGGREVGRSVLWATPIIAVMFILGTSAVLAFTPPAEIDLVSPMSQALTAGAKPGDPGYSLVPLLLLCVLSIRIAQFSRALAGSSRLPLVAGWDNLLPAWFSRLNPRWGTPVQSILFVGGVTLATGLLGIAGVGRQEAFQLLQSSCGILYALTYLVMFALPLFGLRKVGGAVPWWVRGAAVSGFLTTALYVRLSVFPIIDVRDSIAFTAKVIGVIGLSNVVGGMLLWVSYRRRARGN